MHHPLPTADLNSILYTHHPLVIWKKIPRTCEEYISNLIGPVVFSGHNIFALVLYSAGSDYYCTLF
jgi:hypothetical protein